MRCSMIDDLKIFILLLIMAILSAIVRAKTLLQAGVDAILGFIMGYSLYLVFDMFEISAPAKAGCACVVVIFSRPLYDAFNKFIINRLFEVMADKVQK